MDMGKTVRALEYCLQRSMIILIALTIESKNKHAPRACQVCITCGLTIHRSTFNFKNTQ